MEPLLTFEMPLEDSPCDNLICGLLKLTGGTEHEHTFHCTSGQPGWQYSGGVTVPGRGPLPSVRACQISSYFVGTTPIYSPDIPGIRGNFFPIEPETVSVGGVERGDFGIHNDANRDSAPGSAGCIVFVYDYGWEIFQKEMVVFSNSGVKKIPLLVLH